MTGRTTAKATPFPLIFPYCQVLSFFTDMLSRSLNSFSPQSEKICWPIFVTNQYEDKFINRKLERSGWENTKAQGGIIQDEQLAFLLLVELQFINFLPL